MVKLVFAFILGVMSFGPLAQAANSEIVIASFLPASVEGRNVRGILEPHLQVLEAFNFVGIQLTRIDVIKPNPQSKTVYKVVYRCQSTAGSNDLKALLFDENGIRISQLLEMSETNSAAK